MKNVTEYFLSQDEDNRELAEVINQIIVASKKISSHINRAGLTDKLGSTKIVNVQHEEQMKLDAYADELFIGLLRQLPQVAAVGTEESEELVIFDDAIHQEQGQFIVFLDPIDGSSNIDVNVSVGTNFAIYHKPAGKWPLQEHAYLKPGKEVVAAGYLVYGASTMLVFSTGSGVQGFTLDPHIGEFILSHPDMKIPEACTYYSVNESYYHQWSDGIKSYVDELKQRANSPGGRYIGSLVADFHRNLLKGGVYLYPGTKSKPNGKLRLMYEGIPFAYLAEQAGGYGSDGTQSILEIIPESIHQRVPLFVGSKDEVREIEQYLIPKT